MMRYLVTVVLTLLPLVAWALEPVGDLELIEYVRTIDGNTIIVNRDGSEEHIRLFGVDAPDLKEGTPEAFQAAYVLAKFLDGSIAYLETDPVALTDDSGRTMGWIWFRDVDGVRRLVNEQLLVLDQVELYEALQSTRYTDALLEVEPLAEIAEPEEALPVPGETVDEPEAPASAYGLEFTDHDVKFYYSEYGYTNGGWWVEIQNNTGQKCFVDVELKLMDSDGFVLDNAYMWQQLAMPGKTKFSDKFMVRDDLARLVEKYEVYFSVRR